MLRNPLAMSFGDHAYTSASKKETQEERDNNASRALVKARFTRFFNAGGRHIIQEAKKLDGGLTNETYLVRTNSNQYIARIPGRGSEKYINRVNEAHDTAVAFAAGTTAEVVYDEKNGVKVTRYLPNPMELNRSMLRRPECLLEVVAAIKKLHAAPPFATTIDVFARNKKWAELTEERGYLLPAEYLDAAQMMDHIEARFQDANITKVPCHNDLTPGNFILSAGKLYLIDFEYGGNNDPIWDLAYLAMEADFTQAQCEFMLRAYFGDKMSEDKMRRFYLYQPVVEYTVALWCRMQMAYGNIFGETADLAKEERRRFANFKAFMESDFMQNEFNAAIPDGAMHAIENDDDVAEKPKCFGFCRR